MPVKDGTPVATVEDYDPYRQRDLFPNFNSQTQVLAKRHLTPNGGFRDAYPERSFTFITTNIGPQRQPLNEGNEEEHRSACESLC